MDCYLLQALYFCVPFREQLLEYYANNKNLADAEENLLTCLADLFSQVRVLFVDTFLNGLALLMMTTNFVLFLNN